MEPAKLTVRQLNMYVKSLLDGDVNLSAVTLVGEISNFKNHYNSGHLYFVLKDNDAAVKVVMFRANAIRVNFVPADGMTVVLKGYVSLYEKDGQYQFYAESMLPFGKGDIAQEFERIKAKLEGMGLFSVERKRPIPKFPEKIGVITSSTGAAIKDILNISERRYPLCDIVIFPALVQGIQAPESLMSALDKAYKRDDLDIIIIGRGGGSAEDLSCFNDEKLALKIAASPVPVISAVGHETDYTICDYVADLRTPTPSAAAEIALPNVREILNSIDFFKQKIVNQTYSTVLDYENKIELILNKRCFKRPDQIFAPFDLRLDKAVMKLETFYKIILDKNNLRLSNAVLRLETLAYHKTLSKGFAIPYTESKIIKSIKDINVGNKLSIKINDGRINCTVDDISED